MNNLNWEHEHERFMTVAYPRIVKAARRAFWHWKSTSAQRLSRNASGRMGLLATGNSSGIVPDPEPMLAIIKFASLWVRYDRKIAGRARTPEVFDYRSASSSSFSDRSSQPVRSC